MSTADLLQDGATALPFELVWEEVGTGGQEALLLTLLDGSIQAEGILSGHPSDLGQYKEISREQWASLTRDTIQQHLSRFSSLSLTVHDDGSGYSNILLKCNSTLLNLLDYQENQGRVDLEAADVAWYKANGQFFGHEVSALVHAALCQGIIEPKPATLKAFLLSRDDLWTKKGPPGDEALKKFLTVSIKAHKAAARIKLGG